MAINEYDNLVESLPTQTPSALPSVAAPQASANEYDLLDLQDAEEKKARLQQSMFVGAQANPDQKANAIKLSQKLDVPAPLVERNYDEFKKKEPLYSTDYSAIVQNYPGTAEFYSKPENAQVAHDDIENFKNVEDSVKDFSYLSAAYKTLNSGIASTFANLARVPALLNDIGQLPVNLALKAFGSDVELKSPDWLLDNPVAKLYDDQAQKFQTPEMGMSVTQEIAKGNYKRAAQVLFSQFVANAPQQAAILVGALGGYELPSLLGAGLVQGSQVNKQSVDAGVSPIQSTSNAIIQGSVEALFENLGTFGILKKWEGAIAKEYGKQLSKEIFKDFAKTMTYTVAAEGNEEYWTNVAQDLSDYITGTNPEALTGIWQRAADAGIIGGVSGGLMTGPSAIAGGYHRAAQAKNATLARDFYLSMGKTAEATKLRERLPEKQREAVQSIVKDSPVENIYISPEAVDTYFQTKQLNPTAEMQNIGVLDAYTEAKETGGDIKIPLATWAEKVVGTEHYAGLADDIKIDPGEKSVNEAKREHDSVKSQMEAEAAKAEAQQVETQAAESAKSVKDQIKEQLLQAGVSPQEAEHGAALHESISTALAQSSGLDPMELFNRYSLKVNGPEQAQTASTVGDQVLNQASNYPGDIATIAPEGPPDQASISRTDLLNQVNEAPVTKTLFQKDGKEDPLARFYFNRAQGKFNIDLFKNANQSSFLHETGHFYLEVLGDLASGANAPENLKADYQTILDWMGVKSREEIKTDQHEQFARGFEAYLMEGKSPSSKLRKAFINFKLWLTKLYRNIKALNVELTPEVRGVFDRMLATEDEIMAAEHAQNMDPLFEDPIAAGMTEPQAKKYIQARDEAREASEQYLFSKVMNDITHQKEASYQENRSKLREQVQGEVHQSRVYRAIAALTKGTLPDGSEFMPGFVPPKLSKEEIVKQYDKNFLKKLPRGMYSADGLSPQMVAELFGFESGDSMLTQMANAPKQVDAIEQETDRRMKDLYPELLTSDAMGIEAMKAVHNADRSKMLRMELEHLASNNLPALKEVVRRLTRRVPSEQAVRDQAQAIINAKVITEIQPYLFQRAEAKAAKQAGELFAKGDIEGAFEAKRKELLNHELYRAAVDAQEKVDGDVKKFKRMAKADEDLAKSRDIDLVNAARALLGQYGIGRFDGPASKYLDKIKRYDAEQYETILALIGDSLGKQKPYEQMTYQEFTNLSDTITALWDLAKSEHQIEIDGKKLDKDVAIEELATELASFGGSGGGAKLDQYRQTASKWDNVKMFLLSSRAVLRRVESWVDSMDNGNISGLFRKYLFTPVSEAADRYRSERTKALKKYQELLKSIEKDVTFTPIEAPEFGFRFRGKHELLGALLHTGNDSNKSKLLRGWKWGEVDLDGNLNSSRWDSFIARMQREGVLTKADYDFLQGVWNLTDSFKADAQKAHKKIYGFYFNEVTANKFQTPFGEYEGGYVPAKMDPTKFDKVESWEDKEMLERLGNTFAWPTTGKGSTMSRVEAFAAPLIIDLRIIPGHIDWVLRFTHLQATVRDVAKIVHDPKFVAAMKNVDPAVVKEMLIPYLLRAAQQKTSTPLQGQFGRGVDRIGRFLRTRTGLQFLSLNFTNALQNATGFGPALLKVEAKYLRNSLFEFMKAPKKVAAAITEKSIMMEHKLQNQMIEVQGQINDLLLNPNAYEKTIDFAKKHAYILSGFTQNMMDVVTWTGAYDQAVEQGLSELEAVRSADSAVRQTQASGNPEDISRIEAGPDSVKIFTMFSTYFNTIANLNATEYAKAIRELGLKKATPRLLYVYTMGFMSVAVLSELLVRALSGQGFDEDDDDQYLDDFLRIFFGSQVRLAEAFVPAIGPTIGAGVNQFFKAHPGYDDRITSSPAISVLESAMQVPADLTNILTKGEIKKREIKDMLTLLGFITGAPTGALGRPLGYLSDVHERKVRVNGPLDFARGLVTGKGEKR